MPENLPLTKKPFPFWLPFAGVAVVAFLLGGWIFRSGPPASSALRESVPAPQAVAPGAGLAKPEPTAAPQPLPALTDHAGLLQALRTKLAGSVSDVLEALAEISKTQPALAIDLAQALGRTDQEKSEWVTNMTQQWADRDPQATWEWLGKLSSKRMQELASGDLAPVVLGAMAARDPKMVLANVDSMLRVGNTSEAISTPVAVHLGLSALVDHGQVELARKAVEDWAKDPRNLNVEAAAYETVAMELAKTVPQETGDWLRSMPLNDERNAAIATFTATWAEHDPRAALQWAEALAPNEGQQAAIGRTVSDWMERYPNEVTGWVGDYLSRIPAGPNADALVERVVNLSSTVKSNPELALKWTDLISDPDRRKATEENVALRWGRQDRAAAIDYVQKSPTIAPEQKSVLIGKIQNSQFSGVSEE